MRFRKWARSGLAPRATRATDQGQSPWSSRKKLRPREASSASSIEVPPHGLGPVALPQTLEVALRIQHAVYGLRHERVAKSRAALALRDAENAAVVFQFREGAWAFLGVGSIFRLHGTILPPVGVESGLVAYSTGPAQNRTRTSRSRSIEPSRCSCMPLLGL
jgi:hypothetical protein